MGSIGSVVMSAVVPLLCSCSYRRLLRRSMKITNGQGKEWNVAVLSRFAFSALSSARGAPPSRATSSVPSRPSPEPMLNRLNRPQALQGPCGLSSVRP